ncbi:MAG: glycosyltransferase [Planctomycetes bacterium]|nr:glycosyltransferase [Planctomycetota bacterium]
MTADSNKAPSVSAIMTVYNAERYVAEAAESILAQTFTDFEFIIVDDGSTDKSLEILQRHAEQDGRIRLVSRPNTGIIGALNDGLALARSEFIARMDADDISLPERFSKQLGYLSAHPSCIAVGSRALMIDIDGAPICEICEEAKHEGIDAIRLARQSGALLHAAAMIRRETLKAVGGYREEFLHAEDYDLFLRLAEVGRLANLPEVLFKYRQHLASICYTKRQTQSRSVHAALRAACKRRGLEPPADEYVSDHSPPVSKAEHHHRWSRWALRAGNLATARKHAFAAVCEAPLSSKCWKRAIRATWRPLRAALRSVGRSSNSPRNEGEKADGPTT